VNLSAADRLTARSLLIDQLTVLLSQAEHRAAKAEAEVGELREQLAGEKQDGKLPAE
jgi:hypothetical protein